MMFPVRQPMIIIIKANTFDEFFSRNKFRHDTVNNFLGPLLQALSIYSLLVPNPVLLLSMILHKPKQKREKETFENMLHKWLNFF